MGQKHGLASPPKPEADLPGAKGKIPRKLGIPPARSGRQKKAAQETGCLVVVLACSLLNLGVVFTLVILKVAF